MQSAKTKLLFVLLIAVAIGAGYYSVQMRDVLTRSPLSGGEPLVNLSATTVDGEGNTYVVAQSKQEVYSIRPDGTLRYRIGHEPDDSGNQMIFTDVAADREGRLYVLNTVLDPYGLYVLSEHILRYDASGVFDRQLFEWKGDGQSKRIGQVRALTVADSRLSFFISEAESVSLKLIDLRTGTIEQPYIFDLPADRYVSELYGREPGELYYTTKRGAIYEVDVQGESRLIYPLDGSDEMRKKFPERPHADAAGNMYVVDRSQNAIVRLAPGASSTELVVTNEALAEAAPDAESYDIQDFTLVQGGLQVVLPDRVLTFDGAGEVAASVTEAAYDGARMTQRALVWAALVAGVAALLALVGMFHVHVMQRRTSFFLKQSAAFIPLIVISMALLSNTIYNSFTDRLEEEMKRELSVLAQSGKHIIEGDRLERLTSPNDYMNEDYQAIKSRMSFLFEGDSDRRGLYSTLYKYDDGKLYIIADDDDSVNMFKPFPVNEENLLVVEQGRVIAGSWTDSTGEWTYAIAPVTNSAGEVVGIYETGRDMNVLARDNQKIMLSIIRNIVLMTAAILLVFLITTYFMMASLRKLRKSVMDIANGNWDAEVKIRTRDEVADLSEQFNLMVRHIRQYIKDITAFSEASYRFVPQQFFKYLGKRGILDIHLGDQVQRNMVLMVTKIRAFELMSKRLTPKENFNFMNAFLSRFGPIVRQEEGLISSYMGAGFMSLYPRNSEDAVQAAIRIRKELAAYNEHRARDGYQPVDIGVAIHKGPLMLGIVGEETRMEGNVISDDVNLTAMLEEMSANLGVSVLVTRTVMDAMREPERFQFRTLGRIRVEGKGEAMELYDVYEGDDESIRAAKHKTKPLFEQGISLYQQGRFFDAREAFIEVIKRNRQDQAAKLYFYLCDEYYQRGTSADWNGTLAVS
ncbi:HAMP domain-containing protein [Paenibacillus sp. IB182496]|uniref:HAMP domain-containing protein n=1 Tax=Paenibacillus sabuli TaxID=2772509 RepID=A0A927GU18_9BACL|nr:adenylate/guanylate cyclase domain-containing protein [Paenibacillus sabuli]MBD2847891.1 HAMP domain-containing protein [Paenibacillus sabuli]